MQASQQPRVLVVEDNDDLRRVVTTYLGSHGIEILQAADGLSGLERAAEKPDLILLDVLLPKLDGIEFLKRLRASPEGQRIPVVMMSAVLQTRDLQAETSQLQVSGFIQKPFQLRALLEQVRSIVEDAGRHASGIQPRRPVMRQATGRTGPAPPGGAPRTAASAVARVPDSPDTAAPSLSMGGPRGQLPARGAIEDVPLPHLLHAVFSEQRTCRLNLAADGLDRSIFFVGGIPVYAESSIPEETLGAHLVRRGIIGQEQNARAITEMTHTGRRFGEVLLKLGLLGPHDLFRELENHLMDKVIGAFGWYSGRYQVIDGDSWKDDVIIARMPPGRIILSGCQHHWSAAQVGRHVDLGTRMRCAVLGESPYDDRQLALTTSEIRILQLVRKGLAPAEIVAAVPQPELVPPTIFALSVMEVIGFADDSTARQSDVEQTTDIAGLIAGELTSEPPAPPRMEEPAMHLMAEYLKLRTADYFTLLGVSQEASHSEIAAAFQVRQQRYHPDTLVGIDAGLVHEKLEELYLRVHAAYQTLADPEARRRYLAKLEGEPGTSVPSYHPPRGDDNRGDSEPGPEAERLAQEGQALLREGDFRGAAAHFCRAHDLKPDLRFLAYRAWAAYLANPGAERVSFEQELRGLHKEHENEPIFTYLLANYFQREKDTKRAEVFYEKTLEIDPRHIDAARQLRIMRMRQRSDEPSGLFDIFKKG